MAAYRRVYDSCHLRVDCKELGSVPEPYARLSNLYLYFFNGYCFRLSDNQIVSKDNTKTRLFHRLHRTCLERVFHGITEPRWAGGSTDSYQILHIESASGLNNVFEISATLVKGRGSAEVTKLRQTHALFFPRRVC